MLSGEVDLFEIAGESQGGRVDTTIGGSAVVLENSTVAIEGAVLKVTFGALTGVAPRSPALILTDPSGVIASSVVSVGPDGAITTRTSLVDATLTGFDLSTDFIPNLLGTRVLLRNGAQAANVIVSPGFVPFAGLGPTNTVNVAGASGAVLIVDGSTSKIRLAPRPSSPTDTARRTARGSRSLPGPSDASPRPAPRRGCGSCGVTGW